MGDTRRIDAQRRADRIRAFRDELAALRAEGVSPLTPNEEAALATHHSAVLARLAADFDVDRSAGAGQLSRGMQLASLFGAATLIAAVASLVSRYWGGMDLPAQITWLTAFPLLALSGVEIAARRERTHYFAALFALVACGTAWLAIVLAARLLDLPFSVLLLWPGILCGLAVAISYGFRLVLAATLAAATLAVAGAFFASASAPWPEALHRLEPLAVAALVLAGLSRHLEPAGEGFGQVARLTGLVIGMAAQLVMSSAGETSLLPTSASTAEAIHQAGLLGGSVAFIALGLRARQVDVVNTASVFLGLFLLVRYVDWFWDRLPAWAFFLVLAGLAFAALSWLKHLRRRLEAW